MTFRFAVPIFLLVPFILGAGTFVVWGLLKAKKERRFAWVRLVVMLICVGIIGATPSTDARQASDVTNLEVYFLVDITNSMVARDYDGGKERLDGVRADVQELVKSIPNARYGAFTFGSTSRMEVPLTSDSSALISWAQTLHPEERGAATGSSLDNGAKAVLDFMELSSRSRGRAPRVFFLLSDGENTKESRGNGFAWSELRRYFQGGRVFQYGTDKGAQMKEVGPGGVIAKDAPWIIDPDTGKPAISKADPANLRRIAKQLGLEYEFRGASGGLDQVGAQFSALATEKLASSRVFDTNRDLIWPFVWILVGLIAYEGADFVYQMRRLRRAGCV